MKILISIPSTIRGGVEEYTLRIASAAVKAGWEVHVAFPTADATATLVKDFIAAGVNYHHLEIVEKPYRHWVNIRKHLLYFVRTLLLLFRVNPDVVQIVLPSPAHCFGSILACGFLKVPTIVRFGLVPFKWSFSSNHLKAYAWARNRNQQLVAISNNNRKLVSESFQIPEHEVVCIYNGYKTKAASENRQALRDVLRSQLAKELGILETCRLVLTVGRLENQKGYTDLIPVIPHILKEFPDVRFVWVGEGGERDNLSNKLREYGIEDKVFLLGYRSDVPSFLQAADLFVFPTHYEGGQSNAIAEAMAYGLPIVTSDASGIPEVIEDKVHGLTFRTGDSCDLLETLRWSLRHPLNMQEMANNAKKRTEEFSEERMVKETLDLWQKMSHIRRY